MFGSMQMSGGWPYHYTAWRYRRLWAPYKKAMHHWIKGWPVKEARLILVGPSGGYSLPRGYLREFAEVVAFEPDPMARWILKQAFPGVPLQFREGLSLEPQSFTQTLKETPGQILFCNFLGQLPVLLRPDFNPDPWQKELGQLLADRHWASYHDLYSGDIRAKHYQPAESYKGQSEDKIFHDWAKWQCRSELSIEDHQTSGLLKPRHNQRELFLWQRLPKRLHLIEAIY